MDPLRRRDFLRLSGGWLAASAMAGLGTGACARALRASPGHGPGAAAVAGGDSGSQPGEPLFRISLAQWSLHRTLRSGTLDNLEFAAAARERFGLGAVEYVNQFFKDRATDRRYLDEMRTRARDAGVRSLLIMCDGEGRLGDPDAGARATAVENHRRWVEAAALLGCHSIRVNAESDGDRDEQARLVADGLRALGEIAHTSGISVLVENHGGLSSDAGWLAGVMRRVDHPRVGTLPDFGNFLISSDPEVWYDRYDGVRELMPFARAVSAKSHEFGSDAEEVRTDFRRMLHIVLEAGYRGYVGIEYEGSGLDEEQGIIATRDLLVRVRDELDDEFRTAPPRRPGARPDPDETPDAAPSYPPRIPPHPERR